MNAERTEISAKEWNQRLRPYQDPSRLRSVFQILNSAIPFVGMWYLMLVSLRWPYWVTLLLAIPTASLMVRLFIIQHDCGHGSFFKSQRACTVVGSLIGVLTLTPYHYWKREHAVHHATAGNLDKRGRGDIDVMTVAEYRALSPGRKFLYRLYRSPVVLFIIGPIYQFILKHRLPLNSPPDAKWGWASIWFCNVLLAGIVALLCITIGWKQFLLVQAPATLISGMIGVWLFYVQHQYEETYWRRQNGWNYHEAALEGSSWYDLGPVLHWCTGNIGIHHIHHLNSRIPNYRLQECLREVPILQNATRLTLLGSLKCAWLTLWDEEQGKLVGFRGA